MYPTADEQKHTELEFCVEQFLFFVCSELQASPPSVVFATTQIFIRRFNNYSKEATIAFLKSVTAYLEKDITEEECLVELHEIFEKVIKADAEKRAATLQ